ncbi:hypothetical protein CUMW_172840, partial [Citrus unshiu]
ILGVCFWQTMLKRRHPLSFGPLTEEDLELRLGPRTVDSSHIAFQGRSINGIEDVPKVSNDKESRPPSAAMSSVNLALSMPSVFRANVRLVGRECQFAASDASFFPSSSRPLPAEYMRELILCILEIYCCEMESVV